MEIGRFEIGIIRNGNRYTVAVTKDYKNANIIYRRLVDRDMQRQDNDVQTIIFIFDYDKNTNIDYYDSNTDRT